MILHWLPDNKHDQLSTNQVKTAYVELNLGQHLLGECFYFCNQCSFYLASREQLLSKPDCTSARCNRCTQGCHLSILQRQTNRQLFSRIYSLTIDSFALCKPNFRWTPPHSTACSGFQQWIFTCIVKAVQFLPKGLVLMLEIGQLEGFIDGTWRETHLLQTHFKKGCSFKYGRAQYMLTKNK